MNFTFLYFLSDCSLVAPFVANATSSYDAGVAFTGGYTFGSGEVTFECWPNYEFSLDETIQEVECVEEGWDTTHLQHCVLGESQKAVSLG